MFIKFLFRLAFPFADKTLHCGQAGIVGIDSSCVARLLLLLLVEIAHVVEKLLPPSRTVCGRAQFRLKCRNQGQQQNKPFPHYFCFSVPDDVFILPKLLIFLKLLFCLTTLISIFLTFSVFFFYFFLVKYDEAKQYFS